MKISLKKASAIQSSLSELIKQINIATETSVSIFDELSSAVEKQKNNSVNAYNRFVRLNTSYYVIRNLLSKENTKAGIDELLGDLNRIEKETTVVSRLASAHEQNLAVALGAMKKNSEMKESYSFHREDTVVVGLYSSGDIEVFRQMLKTCKKQKQDLKDKILYLNMKHQIELSDDVAEVLKEEGLL